MRVQGKGGGCLPVVGGRRLDKNLHAPKAAPTPAAEAPAITPVRAALLPDSATVGAAGGAVTINRISKSNVNVCSVWCVVVELCECGVRQLTGESSVLRICQPCRTVAYTRA